MSQATGFKAGLAFQQGWSGLSKNAGTLVGFTVLAAIVWGVIQAVQVALIRASTNTPDAMGGLAVLFIGLALLQALLGLIISVALFEGGLQSARGRSITIPDLFKKLTQIPNFIGVQVFGSLAIFLGLLTFVVPGIYLAVAYVFSGMAMVDQPQSFVDALNTSRKLVTPHWFDVCLFLLVVGGVVLLGYLACLIGGFVSVPVGFCMVAAAYDQLLQLAGSTTSDQA